MGVSENTSIIESEELADQVDTVGAASGKISSGYSNQLTSYYPKVEGVRRTSFLKPLKDGGYQTIIYNEGLLFIYNFDEECQIKGEKVIPLELPVWGGVFLGEEYNYVVCGNVYDSSLENGGETYRVIQYDKEFKRLKSISLNGEETYTSYPFSAGNVSIDESGNLLTVYTSRLRLDGHQSNIALRINTEDMSVYNKYGMGSFADVHVSHSFRQIFKYDMGQPVYVDLSDAYPERAVYLQTENISAALVDIAGQIGNNVTNAEVSGLEISDTAYLVTGTYLQNGVNNVFLSSLDKNSGEIHKKWLTNSTMFEPEFVHYPRIIKVDDNRYVIMWGGKSAECSSIYYLLVDGKGEIVSELKEQKFADVTDCEPVYMNGKITWISVKGEKIEFQNISDFSENGIYEVTDNILKAVNPWDGNVDTGWYDEKNDSFYISTAQQLAGLAQLVNQGHDFEGKEISLQNNIFLNDESYANTWIPIGNEEKYSFQGTFNGNTHAIYNMNTSRESNGGLFGYIGDKGSVKAVNIAQGILNSGGSIANQNRGIISFCQNRSLVGSNSSNVGGICNINYNLVYGCKNYGDVWGEGVGGIVGNNIQTLSVVSQCSNEGVVEGTHNPAGLVCYNYGWIYNCYNKGIVSNGYAGNINSAENLSGIVYRNDNCAVENCYTTGVFVYDKDWGLANGSDPIALENYGDVLNCYALPLNENKGNAILISYDEMQSKDFVEKLDYQTHALLSAWMPDSNHINDGFPITVAEDNYDKGIYKLQPELWINGENKEINLDAVGKECSITYNCYYNDEAPIITIGNSEIATIECQSGRIYIKSLKKGSTYINFHIEESENNIGGDYKLRLNVASSGKVDDMFGDVPTGAWYISAVQYVYDHNIMIGKSDTLFEPNGSLTRAEFATVLYNLEEKPAVNYREVFSDVKNNQWYTAPVLWAYENEIASGYPNGKYGISDSIQREQLALMLYKYARNQGYDTTYQTDALAKFSDKEQISGWATEAFLWAVSEGIMSGKGNALVPNSYRLDPKGIATRAECASMIMKLLVIYG